MKRSDVVIVDLRPHDPNAKVRPALIIQNDHDNARMTNTIIALISSNTKRSGEPTQLLIDQNHPDWQGSGLHLASVVNCANIFTIEQQYVISNIGSLSGATMDEINICLKAALGIP